MDDSINKKVSRISNGVKFEDALKKLEKIVEALETGELSLDASLEKYEEGIKLVRLCQKKLEEAKKKIEILVKTKDGRFKLESFDTEYSSVTPRGGAKKTKK
ncbi:MAG: exodeoxyribonuclease VII small subunit [Candidatus Omnitrophica bacterium]|nr:exodeoxyribonuclease VII small subunit [Candidatus Omnitrophota bacterium]